ncbi:MAG: acyl-CoA thioesterase [Gemmatimonadota bacterium]|nr:MAG: acyl-CoA thioesterase [Gemmatimonadota bacterium]
MSDQLLAGYPVVVRIPVQWGEMDAYGHVSNVVFFSYFDSARVLYLERCGFLESYDRQKIGTILHSTSCRFRRRLFYPDTALVGARVTDLADDRFAMAFELVSEAQNAPVAEATSVVVSYDYTTRQVVPVPEDVRAAIERLESPTPQG